MSEYTPNLNLFEYDMAVDNKELFSIDTALNDNWKKIDDFAEMTQKEVDSINDQLAEKLEAEVSLGESGYIKFSNNVILMGE